MATKWSMQGTPLGACSCDWGCPCSFDAPPTQGFCEGGYVWHIEKGKFGNVPLDGLSWSWVGHSPGPLHKGNVTWLVLADEKATPEQRAALAKIAEGKSGGPWTILMAVAGSRGETQYMPFEVKVDGLKSKVRAGEALWMELGPILNPVTKKPESVRLEHGTGFIFQNAECLSAREMKVKAGELDFSWPDKAGFISQIKYGN